MSLIKPIEDLFNGRCFQQFERMDSKNQFDTLVKTALIGSAVFLGTVFISPPLAIAVTTTSAIYAFAYFTSNFSYAPILNNIPEIGKDVINTFVGVLKNNP